MNADRPGLERAWLWVLLAAVAVRGAFVLESAAGPFWGVPVLDERFLHEWALRLATGEWPGVTLPFFRAPLYPVVLSLLYALFGDGPLVPQLLQHLLGIATALLVLRIGGRLYDPRVGLVAGLAVAVCPVLVFFEGQRLIDSLTVFLNVAALAVLLVPRDADRPWPGLVGGLLLGLSAAARPTVLVTVPVVLVWLAWPRGGRVRAPAPLLFLAGVALAVAPVTATNLFAGGDPVPISTQGGINYYIGNRPGADGYSVLRLPGAVQTGPYRDAMEDYSREEALRRSGTQLEGSSLSRFWYRETFREREGRWGSFWALQARKVLLFWSGVEIPNNKSFYAAHSYSRTLAVLAWLVSFRWVGPLALVGIGLALARGGGWRRMTAIFVLVYMMGVVAYFVCSRFRAPVLPLLIVFAAAALFAVVDAARERRQRAVFGLAAALVAAGVLVNGSWVGPAARVYASDYWFEGHAWMQRQRTDRALAAFERGLRLDPELPELHYNKGVCLKREGDVAAALAAFEEAARLVPGDADAWIQVGHCRLLAGRPEQARQAFDRAIEVGGEEARSRIAPLLPGL